MHVLSAIPPQPRAPLPRLPRGTSRLARPDWFEALALIALALGVVQAVLQFDLVVAAYGPAMAWLELVGLSGLGLAAIFAISRLGLKPVAVMYLVPMAVALGFLFFDIANASLGTAPADLVGFASLAFDAGACALILHWLVRGARAR